MQNLSSGNYSMELIVYFRITHEILTQSRWERQRFLRLLLMLRVANGTGNFLFLTRRYKQSDLPAHTVFCIVRQATVFSNVWTANSIYGMFFSLLDREVSAQCCAKRSASVGSFTASRGGRIVEGGSYTNDRSDNNLWKV
jgi:hypothetical protein